MSKETLHLICKDLENPNNTTTMIAQKYGIDDSTVAQIRSGKSHIDISNQYNIIQNPYNNRRKLSEDEVRKICESLSNGILSSKIAKQYNVALSTIYAIKNRTSYTNISDEYPDF